MIRLAIFGLVGALAGAVLGYANQCAGGSCPLVCVWWRGAAFGLITGVMVGLAGWSRHRQQDKAELRSGHASTDEATSKEIEDRRQAPLRNVR